MRVLIFTLLLMHLHFLVNASDIDTSHQSKSTLIQSGKGGKINTNHYHENTWLNAYLSIKAYFSNHQRALRLTEKAEKDIQGKKYKRARRKLIKAHDLDNLNSYTMQKLIEAFAINGDYMLAANYIVRIPSKNPGAKNSKLYHLAGMLAVEASLAGGGGPCFVAAKEYLMTALEIEKNKTKSNYDLLTEIYNLLGFLSIVRNGYNKQPNHKDIHIHFYKQSLMEAQTYFVESLRYNPKNEQAKENLGKLLIALNANSEPEIIPYNRKFHAEDNFSLDDIKVTDSLTTEVATVDVFNVPSHFQFLYSKFKDYDEIMLVMDYSGSMSDCLDKKCSKTRHSEMVDIASFLLESLPKKCKMGAISVGGNCNQQPQIDFKTGASRDVLKKAILIGPDGLTPLNHILNTAINYFTEKNNSKAVILFSDGLDVCGGPHICKIAEYFSHKNIQINVVSLLLEESRYQTEFGAYTCLTDVTNGAIYQAKEEQTKPAKPGDRVIKRKYTLKEIKKSNCLQKAEELYCMDIIRVEDGKFAIDILYREEAKDKESEAEKGSN